MISVKSDLQSPRVNITGENRTLKQLLTEPYRVQKKDGYYSFDGFRSEVLASVANNAKPLLQKKAIDVLDKMAEGMENAYHHGDTDDANKLLGMISAISFLYNIPYNFSKFFYIDKNLFDVFSETKPPKSITIDYIFFHSFIIFCPIGAKVKAIYCLKDHHNEGLFYITPYVSCETGLAPLLTRALEIGKEIEFDSSIYDSHTPITNFVFSFLLWQQSIHDKGDEVIELDAPTRKMGFGKNSKQIIVPRVIGEGYKPKVVRNYEPTGTHASPRTHWRSGHWRQQPCGKKDDPKLKTIWLEPVLVNG